MFYFSYVSNAPENRAQKRLFNLYRKINLCLSFWITLLKSRLPHISSYAVQALTQSEVVIILRERNCCVGKVYEVWKRGIES